MGLVLGCEQLRGRSEERGGGRDRSFKLEAGDPGPIVGDRGVGEVGKDDGRGWDLGGQGREHQKVVVLVPTYSQASGEVEEAPRLHLRRVGEGDGGEDLVL